jgi:hypothetical protein
MPVPDNPPTLDYARQPRRHAQKPRERVRYEGLGLAGISLILLIVAMAILIVVCFFSSVTNHWAY